MTMSDAAPAPAELTRDDLEDEVSALRQRVAALEQIIDVRADDLEDASLSDVFVCGQPLGVLVENATERSKENTARLDECEQRLDAAGVDVNASVASLSDAVRDRLLPAHERYMDLKTDRADRIGGDTERRAARLFGHFVRAASGRTADSEVDASGQTYTLTSSAARIALESATDMTQKGQSMTVKRAMHEVQRLTRVEDCDCPNIDDCEHGVITFQKKHGVNTLVVAKRQFNAVLQNVATAVDGSVGAPDDSATTDEGPDRDNVDAELERLTNGQSNTVVRRSEGELLDRRSGGGSQ